MAIFGGPSSTPWVGILNNFYLKHFWIYCVFLAASRPKVNLLCHFCILIFTFFACFKDGGHWLYLDTGVTHLRLVQTSLELSDPVMIAKLLLEKIVINAKNGQTF